MCPTNFSLSKRDDRLKLVGQEIEVRVYKHDGILHRNWPAELLRRDGPLIVLDATFTEEITHDLLGTIVEGTHSLEFYWLDRWYNIFRFAQADGRLRNYYCNVNIPPTFADGVLSYVDLDLDILVEPDFSYRILDLEDFEANVKRGNYSAETETNAQRAVDELVRMIQSRSFPFDSNELIAGHD